MGKFILLMEDEEPLLVHHEPETEASGDATEPANTQEHTKTYFQLSP